MAEQDVPVPNVAESVTEVTILNWHKQPGDFIQADEPLAEVETDKANVDIPAPFSGVVTAVLAAVGQTKRVGEVIARMDPDAKAGAAAGGSAKSAVAAGGSTATATATATVPQTGSRTSMTQEGEPPAKAGGPGGNGAATLTDLSPAVRRLVSENNVDVSQVRGTGPGGRLTKEDVERFLSQDAARGASSAPGAVPRGRPLSDAAEEGQAPRIAPQPAQKAATGTADLPARPVAGVGVGGQPTRREAMSKIRKRIAQNLVQAQQTAAILTTFNEVDLGEVMALRKKYKEPFEKKHGIGLGFMSFFARAACVALREFERVNARIDGEEIVFHDYVNLGIAVSTERGLTVPVLKNAHAMSFAQIESEIKRVALAARDGKLGIEEMSGGTFTVTNGGIFGSLLSTPILNAPQSGILGMHNIQDRAMVVNGEITIRPMMYLALSYDHRIVDGRESVSFLVRIKQLLEDPSRLLLDV